MVAALGPVLDRLEEKGNVGTCSRSLYVDALSKCLNSRTGQVRKTRPNDKHEHAVALWEALQFRSGRKATIHGLMMAAMMADRETVDGMDTLAVLLVENHKLVAAAWRKQLDD